MILDEIALRALIEEVVRTVVREELRAVAPRPGQPDEFLSVVAAARLVGVAPTTVRTWVSQGRLQRYQAGRVLRVRRSELEVLLASAPADDASRDISAEARARMIFEKNRRAAEAPRITTRRRSREVGYRGE
jgi:excisionase family DNA binding protein